MKAINGSALECAIINAHGVLDSAGYISDIIKKEILTRPAVKKSVKEALTTLLQQQQVQRERFVTAVEHIYFD